MRSAETPNSSASVVQGGAGSVVVGQPARFDDAALTRVQLGQRLFQAFRLQPVALLGLQHLGRLGPRPTTGRRSGRTFVVLVVGRRFERDVAARQARFHLDHFLALDAELLGHRVDLLPAFIASRPGFMLRRLKNSLRCALVVATLTRRQLLQDVLVHLGPDPVHRKRHQAHARAPGRSA